MPQQQHLKVLRLQHLRVLRLRLLEVLTAALEAAKGPLAGVSNSKLQPAEIRKSINI